MSSRNYIPRNDEEFQKFFYFMVQYVKDKTSFWGHIPGSALNAFGVVYDEWYKAYEVMLRPHTPPETSEKNRVKADTFMAVRKFVNRFLRHEPVTDEDRDRMHIPNRKKTRTRIGRPADAPEFTLKPIGNRLLQVDFWQAGSTGKARPYGYSGAVVSWGLFDSPPTSFEAFTGHHLATRTPFVIEFTEADRGKRVYVALCWQNATGQCGPWSDIKVTMVP